MVRANGVARATAEGQCQCGSLQYSREGVHRAIRWYGHRMETYTAYQCGTWWHIRYADSLTRASRRRTKAGAR